MQKIHLFSKKVKLFFPSRNKTINLLIKENSFLKTSFYLLHISSQMIKKNLKKVLLSKRKVVLI